MEATQITIGQKVKAVIGLKFQVVTITEINNDGSFEIESEDGEFEDREKWELYDLDTEKALAQEPEKQPVTLPSKWSEMNDSQKDRVTTLQSIFASDRRYSPSYWKLAVDMCDKLSDMMSFQNTSQATIEALQPVINKLVNAKNLTTKETFMLGVAFWKAEHKSLK